MYIDGDVLVISSEMDVSDVEELKNFIESRLEFIEEIHFEEEAPELFTSSSIFQLLFAIKKSKPEIKIPVIEKECTLFKNLGTIQWISNG